MKRIKLFLAVAMIVAVASAFATSANFAPCDETGTTIYGKTNLAGDDFTLANFTDISTVTQWRCDINSATHCLYYFDEAQQKFLPCNPLSTENRKFVIVTP